MPEGRGEVGPFAPFLIMCPPPPFSAAQTHTRTHAHTITNTKTNIHMFAHTVHGGCGEEDTGLHRRATQAHRHCSCGEGSRGRAKRREGRDAHSRGFFKHPLKVRSHFFSISTLRMVDFRCFCAPVCVSFRTPPLLRLSTAYVYVWVSPAGSRSTSRGSRGQ